MKKQFVEGLREGDRVNDYFVATRKDLRDQQSGGKFLGMVFKDRTGDIGGILWNNAVAIAKLFQVGDVVNVRGSVTSYQGRLQIRVDQVLPLRASEYDTADLTYIPEDADAIAAKFDEILATVENEWLRTLLDAFLDDTNLMERFRKAPAGKKWHHAYPGGLARHCYEVARLVLTACELFPELYRDVLITAVLIHDIGKVDEMRQDTFIDYGNEGRLLGHMAIGLDIVQKKLDAVDGFPENLRLQLLHCVVSHHGELVNGSPIVPKTPEAMVLYHCDNLDAQADALTRIVGETRQRGESWSDYIPLIERQVWTKEG